MDSTIFHAPRTTPRQAHWSFLPPQCSPLPAIKNTRWPRNPIDHFILAKLERERVTPSPEADRATLIRRLSLDLLGLPPTIGQVRAFLADRRPDAYEMLVDSLLASPHFGERWGRHWLDLARYADSAGYQIDRARPGAYLYRNWVIGSFNCDQPFDQFTLEQLAGDLLPDATTEQKIATGFHRNTMMNHEEGVYAEEFRCKARVDRAATTGAVWLGLTVGCAQCHNHKYDPITQREFYQLYALFNETEEVDIPAPQPKDKGASAMGFRQTANPPTTFVHVRGDYLRPGDEVRPGVLAVLNSFTPRTNRADRLDLARWLVHPANPLTARVAVNHLWQHLFGRGLVNTAEDFGARGDPPSHPELLDWLAVTFMSPSHPQPARAWSRKPLIKLIVTSATYRQSSHVREELAERDPLNTWLARQLRFRVESEIVRDLHLAVGGMLNTNIGGPSFRPRTTADFKKLGHAGAFVWDDSTGPDLHRRGLYVFAQRTVPYPTAMTFDQANPCESCPRRERSNTALQALTQQNHGLFVECAQALARRVLAVGSDHGAAANGAVQPGGSTLDPAVPMPANSRITQALQLALARKPSKDELARLEQLLADELRLLSSQPAAELAAYTTLCQVIMNLDEFVTRE